MNQLTTDQAVRMCEIFGVSVEWLIAGKDTRSVSADGAVSYLDRLDIAEMTLIQAYRMATEAGKAYMDTSAEIAEKLPAKGL